MPPVPASPNDLTRQQLDELDALLQRMLSLPITPPDPFAPPAPAPPIPVPAALPTPAPTTAAALSLFAPPPTDPVPEPPPAREPVPPAPSVRESFPPLPPVSRRADPPGPAPGPHLYAAPVTEIPRPSEPPPAPPPPARKPTPTPTPEPPPAADPIPTPTPTAKSPRPEPAPTAPPSGPGSYSPFVLLNRGINAALGLLGLPGRVMRSGFVKNVFGYAGLGLLLYTGAKVAQLQGWILFPVELPWPR